MKKSIAVQIAHTLSNPAKMPCKGYSLPASACITGSKLRQCSGTVCSDCYACKGCYQFPVVQEALQKRLDSITHPQWCEAMIANIGKAEYFRWHDSGDLQSVDHLSRIVEVCRGTPNCSHWLPTKEKAIVRAYIRAHGSLPGNLIIRYSAPMIDGVNVEPIAEGVHSSNSISSQDRAPGHLCRAFENDGECGDCRACWNKDIYNVSYLMH